MCRVLEVSRSGFYRWLKMPDSRRKKDTMRLDVEIKAIFEENKHRYGSPKITEELQQRGRRVGHNRVAKRMRENGLRSKVRRKYKVTTNSKHNYPASPNLLNRKFEVDEPDKVWVSDITYVWTRTGWLYLTVFIDLYSRMVVGWAVSASLSTEMVLKAFRRALWLRKPPKGLMIHSDRGIQYACEAFREALRVAQCVQSMSRKGNCWDNAVAESFFRAIKTELLWDANIADRTMAERIIFEYIEVFYNRQRLHATNGYRSPAEFEVKSVKRKVA